MATNPAVTQVAQFGVESTYGTAVAASKRFRGLNVDLQPMATFKAYQAAGSKVPTLHVRDKQWSGGKFSGPLTYTELIWVLACSLGITSPVLVGTAGKKWVSTPNAYDVDASKSLTIERGNSVYASKAAGVKIPDWSIVLTRDSADISGSLLGGFYTPGVTLTAAPTDTLLVPVTPDTVDIFLDPTFGAIGTSKVLGARRTEIKLAPKLRDNWVLNSTFTSLSDIFDKTTSLDVTVRVNCDAAAFASYNGMVNGATQFLRVQADGGVMLGDTAHYLITLDMPVEVRGAIVLSNDNDVYVADLVMGAVPDTTLGGFLVATVQNLIAAL